MKTNIEPLQPECFYHIYNRGINGENIFKEERNYEYFLKKYAQYVSPYVDTYAYCMLKNHFHLLVRTHSEEEIGTLLEKTSSMHSKSLLEEKGISWWLSNVFASLFKSYAQAINKAHKRTGALFEEPFRRILIDNDAYFSEMIYYTHHNPQKHGFVKDFRDYPHSSYHSYLRTANTKLKREEGLAWFGDRAAFCDFHQRNQDLKYLDKFEIEID